jgi:hypothetical protein
MPSSTGDQPAPRPRPARLYARVVSDSEFTQEEPRAHGGARATAIQARFFSTTPKIALEGNGARKLIGRARSCAARTHLGLIYLDPERDAEIFGKAETSRAFTFWQKQSLMHQI